MPDKGAAMQLQYAINGIGIYVAESGDAAWNASVADSLQKELDISLREVDERKVEQKLLIKPYSLLSSNPVRQGFVTPHHSVYDDGLLMSFSHRVAFKLKKDCLSLWVDRDRWPDFQFVLQLLFAQRDMLFVHSAGITINDKGVVLPAACGVGKTSFVSEAAKIEGVKILGDDFVLLDSSGNVYPYPRPFGLRYYHRKSFPAYFSSHSVKYRVELSLRERVIERIKYILRNLPGTFFPSFATGNRIEPNIWNRNIDRLSRMLCMPDRIYDDKQISPSLLFEKGVIADRAVPLERVYVTRCRRGIKEIRCTPTHDIEGIVNFCTGVLFHETYESLRLTFNMLVVKEQSPSSYYKFFEDVIRQGISCGSSHYLVDVPEGMPAQELSRGLIDLILNNE